MRKNFDHISDEMINILAAALSYQENLISGLSFQAFTNLKCNWCEKEYLNSTTTQLIFCRDCVKDLSKIIRNRRGINYTGSQSSEQ